jgi:hypothetical protein
MFVSRNTAAVHVPAEGRAVFQFGHSVSAGLPFRADLLLITYLKGKPI